MICHQDRLVEFNGGPSARLPDPRNRAHRLTGNSCTQAISRHHAASQASRFQARLPEGSPNQTQKVTEASTARTAVEILPTDCHLTHRSTLRACIKALQVHPFHVPATYLVVALRQTYRLRDTAAIWVVADPQSTVVAYAVIAMTGIDLRSAPTRLAKQGPDPITRPAVRPHGGGPPTCGQGNR
jgi:hypothetical protein